MKFNERTARLALQDSAKQTRQDGLRNKNHDFIKKQQAEIERKRALFISNAKVFVFRLICAAVIIFTISHFA